MSNSDSQPTRSLNITEALREQLLQGEFPPHARLQEIALAERMGVSRTPIREALSVLARDGLLEYAPNRGYTVRHFSLDDILSAFRVRAVLEGLGCRLLAERGLPADTDTQLQHTIAWGDTLLQNTQLQQGQFDQWREMNKAFHLAILLATQNDLLIRFAKISRNIPIVFNGSFRWYSTRDFRRSQDHHEVIYSAMKNRQPERADFMMQEHIMQAAEILRRNYPV
ncbi:MAG TPA: GntR family transcriptional regulator [Candidatus Kapabacteria bacterium]|nr:GntR family transcriptional regulator [Candidatus Kapabacteria bacterium]